MDEWALCDDAESEVSAAEINYFESCFGTLFQLQQDVKLCDVEIECRGGNVAAHKVVLAATCDYFKNMFSSFMIESGSKVIRMKSIDADVMQILVTYLYTRKLTINKNDAEKVLKAANLLMIETVERACCEMLLGPVCSESALEYAILAERYNLDSLMIEAIKFLLQDATKLCENNSLFDIGERAFIQLITNDDLGVQLEEQVFEMVVRWVEHEPKSRSKYFNDLLCHVRLPLIAPSFLIDQVESYSLVRDNLKCRDLVDEAKNRHLIPSRSKGYISERMTPRKSMVGYIFLVGGLTVREKHLQSVERYDLPLQQSFAMPDMTVARSGLGTAILNKKLYVVGGHDGNCVLKTGECLDFGKGSWTWVMQLSHPRRNLGFCTDNTRMFAVGGQVDSTTTLNSVEAFDPREGLWKLIAPLEQARKYANVVTYKNCLYVVGGNCGKDYLQSCERYELRMDKWVQIPSLPKNFGANGLTVYDNKIVTVGGFDSRQCLDTSFAFNDLTNVWELLPGNTSSRRTGLGAVTAGHKLYALAGHSGENYLNTVEVYNPQMKSWDTLSPLHYHRGAMGVAVLENCYMTQTDPL